MAGRTGRHERPNHGITTVSLSSALHGDRLPLFLFQNRWFYSEPYGIKRGQKNECQTCSYGRATAVPPMSVYAREPQKTENVSGNKCKDCCKSRKNNCSRPPRACATMSLVLFRYREAEVCTSAGLLIMLTQPAMLEDQATRGAHPSFARMSPC